MEKTLTLNFKTEKNGDFKTSKTVFFTKEGKAYEIEVIFEKGCNYEIKKYATPHPITPNLTHYIEVPYRNIRIFRSITPKKNDNNELVGYYDFTKVYVKKTETQTSTEQTDEEAPLPF